MIFKQSFELKHWPNFINHHPTQDWIYKQGKSRIEWSWRIWISKQNSGILAEAFWSYGSPSIQRTFKHITQIWTGFFNSNIKRQILSPKYEHWIMNHAAKPNQWAVFGRETAKHKKKTWSFSSNSSGFQCKCASFSQVKSEPGIKLWS